MNSAKVKHLYNFQIKNKTSKFHRKEVNRLRLFTREFAVYAKVLVSFLLITFSIFLVIRYVKSSSVLKVKHIDVQGTKHFVNKEDVYNLSIDSIQGTYLFKVDTTALEESLKNVFQGAKSIKVSRVFPSSICINITERVPLAIVHNPNSEDYYLVDEDGYILGLVSPENSNLPKVVYEEPLRVGFFIDKELVPLYLELIGSIDETSLKTSSISVKDSGIDFYIENSVLVHLSREKSIPESVDVLFKLYRQLVVEGKGVKKIDLRYDKVVVEYDE